MAINEGDKAPDFTLVAAGGQRISLRDTLQGGRHVLLVFLRHLG